MRTANLIPMIGVVEPGAKVAVIPDGVSVVAEAAEPSGGADE